MRKLLPHVLLSLLFVSPNLFAEAVATSNEPATFSSDEPRECSSFNPFTGKVSGNRVRLRTSATRDGHVIREICAGEMFAVTGQTNDFFMITPPKGTKGYVFRTFVLDNVVEGERVNIRLQPDMDAPVIGQLHAGQKLSATVAASNNKWLEITLPETVHFYIAKEFVENVGSIDLVTKAEARRSEATHRLNAAFLYATSEMQKPFEEIEPEGIQKKFNSLLTDFADYNDVVEKAQEAGSLIEDLYTQKKIAFLEAKANKTTACKDIDISLLTKLAKTSIKGADLENLEELSKTSSLAVGHTAVANDASITDKMLVWQALEESLYHLWAAENAGRTMEEFYGEEKGHATVLTGIVEPYNRPVKNRPGDFVLKIDSLPTAFLYSTKVNLHDMVGKKVTILATNRPNNNFAFPAYFVLEVE